MANIRSGGLRSPDARRKFIMGGIVIVLIPIVGFIGYTFAALSWSYSDGDRSGILQKFSRKGWICKTYEGELAMSYTPGLAPVLWNFSVREEGAVDGLGDVRHRQGHGETGAKGDGHGEAEDRRNPEKGTAPHEDPAPHRAGCAVQTELPAAGPSPRLAKDGAPPFEP